MYKQIPQVMPLMLITALDYKNCYYPYFADEETGT